MLSKKVAGGAKIKPKDRPHYVNSKEFEDQIRVFYTTGECSDTLSISITKIAEGLSYAPNFINYSYKDEMVGDAVVKMFQALRNKKFVLDSKDGDGNNYSPFSYFTTIAFHAFINRIKKEKKQQEIIADYKKKVYEDIMGDQSITNGYIYFNTADGDNGDNNDVDD